MSKRRMRFFREIAVAGGLVGVLVLAFSGSGCGLPASWSEPPDPYTKLRRQPGVVRLSDSPLGGRVELTFRGSDFTESSLKLPEGDYTIVVKNADSLTDIGFFLRKPDRYGRETAGHVAAGGGIRTGSERRFEVSLRKDTTYLFNEPITESPSHQITVIPAVVMAAPVADSDSDEGPDRELEDVTTPGLDTASGAPSKDASTEIEASESPKIEPAAEPAPDGEMTEKTAPKAEDEPAFSPEVERLLDAFDRAKEPR